MYSGDIVKVSVSDLYEVALLRCGQHAVIDTVKEEFTEDMFWKLLKYEIYPFYTNYFFKTKRLNVYVSPTAPITFPEPSPSHISKIVPVSVYGLYIGEFLNFRFMSHVSYLSTRPMSKFSVTWKYERPVLHVGYQGEVMIEAQYGLEIDEDNREIEIVAVTRDEVQELCNGLVLLVLGRSRRMLKVPDNVVEFDAESMVSEGEAIYQKAKEAIIRIAEISAVNF